MIDIVRVALSQYDITETVGPQNNPEVMKYYHETGRAWVSADETPWCDAFVDWCAMKAGYKWSPGLNARAWLEEGVKVPRAKVADLILEVPIVCILWRISKDSDYGHAGLPIRLTKSHVWLLGGNQNNRVKIERFPSSRELGFIRITETI